MGAWSFVQPMLTEIAGRMGRTLRGVSRPASGSPATGSHSTHDLELEELEHAVVDGL